MQLIKYPQLRLMVYHLPYFTDVQHPKPELKLNRQQWIDRIDLKNQGSRTQAPFQRRAHARKISFGQLHPSSRRRCWRSSSSESSSRCLSRSPARTRCFTPNRRRAVHSLTLARSSWWSGSLLRGRAHKWFARCATCSRSHQQRTSSMSMWPAPAPDRSRSSSKASHLYPPRRPPFLAFEPFASVHRLIEFQLQCTPTYSTCTMTAQSNDMTRVLYTTVYEQRLERACRTVPRRVLSSFVISLHTVHVRVCGSQARAMSRSERRWTRAARTCDECSTRLQCRANMRCASIGAASKRWAHRSACCSPDLRCVCVCVSLCHSSLIATAAIWTELDWTELKLKSNWIDLIWLQKAWDIQRCKRKLWQRGEGRTRFAIAVFRAHRCCCSRCRAHRAPWTQSNLCPSSARQKWWSIVSSSSSCHFSVRHLYSNQLYIHVKSSCGTQVRFV